MSDQLEQDLEELLARRAACDRGRAGGPARGHRGPPGLAGAGDAAGPRGRRPRGGGVRAAAIWRLEGTVAAPPVQPSPVGRRQRPTPRRRRRSHRRPPPGRRRRGSARWWACSSASGRSRRSARPSATRRSAARSWTTPDDGAGRVPRRGRPRLRHDPALGLHARDDSPAVDPLRQPQRWAARRAHRPRAHPAGWVPYQLAACDAADFDSSLPMGTGMDKWVDADGNPVPLATLSEVADCYDGTQLHLDGRLYVRDLRGAAYDRATPARLVRGRRVAAAGRRRHRLPPGPPAAVPRAGRT